MTSSRFSHLALNVTDLERSVRFYLETLEPLGLRAADGEPSHYARLTNGRDLVLVLAQAEARFLDRPHHRKTPGLHHFALAVPTPADLAEMARHLERLGVPLLGGQLHASDYRGGYSGLMFEDPDRITIEIAHHHPDYYA
jgi:catechol 2,3-dioxygenase-like lactoylglutathione lyase family enzyme